MPEPKPLRIFLSYAHVDMTAVRKLRRYLCDKGFDVWFDKESLVPGQDWQLEIEKGLNRSDVILVCLSSIAVSQEGFVQKEFRFALERALEMPEGRIFLIPLRLQPCEVPTRLSRYHWVDLFDDEQAGYHHLLRALELRTQQTAQKSEQERLIRENVAREQRTARAKTQARLKISALLLITLLLIGMLGLALWLLLPDLFPATGIPTSTPKIFTAQTLFPVTFTSLPPAKTMPPTTDPATATPAASQTQLTKAQITANFAAKATVNLGIGSTMLSDKDGMELVFVSAGKFEMGSNNGESDEQPVHTVYLDDFWIDKTEVTNAMYALCMQAGICQSRPYYSSVTRHNYGNASYVNYPVIYVNWNRAQTYCKWAGRRLPSEAEWEKAARWKPSPTEGRQGEGEALTYSWGNTSPTCDLANLNRTCNLDTSIVGNYPNDSSPYGALDMTGNVWEWVVDWYDGNYYQNSPSSNPSGPTSGQYRTMRGGAWDSPSRQARSAYRSKFLPTDSYYNIGFRCALSQ